MRLDGRGKPFYARVRQRDQTIDSTHYATAAEAGAAYDRMAAVFIKNPRNLFQNNGEKSMEWD